jgi:hypothetical protein
LWEEDGEGWLKMVGTEARRFIVYREGLVNNPFDLQMCFGQDSLWK